MVETTLAPTIARLRTIRTQRQLCALMGVDYAREFSFVLRRLPPSSRYYSFEIERKGGGTRTISAPMPLLKKLQSRLLPLLYELYAPPPCVHGFVPGRSIVTNAEAHVGQRYILNVDISDFFPSIHFLRIVGILQTSRYGLCREIAVAVAQIACLDGRLPIGSPVSGVLANIVCGPLDSEILRMAKENRITYTRYADDITISTSNHATFQNVTGINLRESIRSNDISALNEELIATFNRNGFSINPNKVNASSRHSRQIVTGIKVNKKCNVKSEFYRNTRATIRAIEKHGYPKANISYGARHRGPHNASSLEVHLLGEMSFLGQVLNYSERYNKLARRVKAIFPARNIPTPRDDQHRAIYVVQTTPDDNFGTAFHIGGGFFVTAAHIFEHNDEMRVCRLWCPTHFPGPVTAVCTAIDRTLDIALIRPTGDFSETRPIVPIDYRDVRAGDDVIVRAFPQYNDGNSISVIQTRVTAYRNLAGADRLEVDRPLSHGASGGPVFSMDGFLAGIVMSGPPIGEDYSPMSYTFTPFRVLSAWLREHTSSSE